MDDHTLPDAPPPSIEWPKLASPDPDRLSGTGHDPHKSVDVAKLSKIRRSPTSRQRSPVHKTSSGQSVVGPQPAQNVQIKPNPVETSESIRVPNLQPDDYAKERAIDQIFQECQTVARQFQNAGTRREHILIKCLQLADQLYEHGQKRDPEGYEQLLAKYKIKVTKRTSNPFTPVVKLVFHALEKRERTTISRYASVLRYAQDEGIGRADFPSLIKEDGGIEGCVRWDRGQHPNPERAAALTKSQKHYETLLESAQSPDFASIEAHLPAGMSVVLVEKDQHGQVRLLGTKQEKRINARSYLPFPKK